MAKLSRIKIYHFQHALKFYCTAHIPSTSQTTDTLLPGTCKTAVNIQNPHEIKIKSRKKFASPIQVSKFKTSGLKPDGVERVTCSQIREFDVKTFHGFEGFLVVESRHNMDMTAVYTAGDQEGQVVSIDVQQIKERQI